MVNKLYVCAWTRPSNLKTYTLHVEKDKPKLHKTIKASTYMA